MPKYNLLPSATFPHLIMEQCLKHRPNQRLDKKQLGEKCKREVKAHQLQPVCQQRKKVKPYIVRVIEPCCQKAHGRAHQPYSGTDNSCFKYHRMGLPQFKILTGQAKRTGAPHNTFQPISKNKFNQDDCPYRHHLPKHIDTALCIYGMDHRICACHRHQRGAIDDSGRKLRILVAGNGGHLQPHLKPQLLDQCHIRFHCNACRCQHIP